MSYNFKISSPVLTSFFNRFISLIASEVCQQFYLSFTVFEINWAKMVEDSTAYNIINATKITSRIFLVAFICFYIIGQRVKKAVLREIRNFYFSCYF